MKFFFLLFFIAPALFASFDGVSPGHPAPDFVLKGNDGNDYKLSEFKGKTIVLEWFNKDCPFVRKHYDTKNMQQTQKLAKEQNVVWFSVVSSAPNKQGHETPASATMTLLKEDSKARAILLDPKGSVGRLYGAKTTPHMFVINPQGNIAYVGAIDSISSADPEDVPKATNYVISALEEIKNNKPVTKQYARPYGCSVKYAK